MFRIWKRHPQWPLVSPQGRLQIRPAKKKDLEIMMDWFQDLQLVRCAFGYVEASEAELQRTARDYRQQISRVLYTLIAIEEVPGRLIGLAKFDLRNTKQGCMALTGIMLGQEGDRGRGLGQEALELVIAYLFEFEGVAGIEMETAKYNQAALRCFEKVGFSQCPGLFSLVNMELYPEIENLAAPKLWLRLEKSDWVKNHPAKLNCQPCSKRHLEQDSRED